MVLRLASMATAISSLLVVALVVAVVGLVVAVLLPPPAVLSTATVPVGGTNSAIARNMNVDEPLL
jgi:preprotein translocase subunit SecG